MGNLSRVKIVGTKVGAIGGNHKCVMIVGFCDEKGIPFEPVPPGPTPSAQLEVATPTETSGSTTLGSTLTGTPATFTGGEPPVVVKTRWERSVDDTPASWAPLSDYEVDGPTTYTTVAADNGRYLRFATQATDNEQFVAGSFGDSIGPMTPAPITVTQGTRYGNGTFSDPSPVYSFETLHITPAVFSGGFGTLTEEYRLQEDTGSGWTNITGWTLSEPTYDVSQSNPGDQLRFQSRATDETGATKISNSPVATVGVTTTIGVVSIAPPSTTADPNQQITFDVINSGDANPFWMWQIRSGPGRITSFSNIGPQIQVTVDADAASGAAIQVQVDGSDSSASDSPKGTLSTIIVN